MKYCRIKLPAGSTDYTIFFPGKAASRKSAICIGALYLHRNILLQSGFETVLLDVLPTYTPHGSTVVNWAQWQCIRQRACFLGGSEEIIAAEVDEWAESVFQTHAMFTIFGS